MAQDLTQEFYSNVIGLLKYLLLCPLAGFMMTVCLFKIIEALQILPVTHEPIVFKKKVQCWVYLSIFAASIGLLVQSFS